MKGILFVKRMYIIRKGYLFCKKMVIRDRLLFITWGEGGGGVGGF